MGSMLISSGYADRANRGTAVPLPCRYSAAFNVYVPGVMPWFVKGSEICCRALKKMPVSKMDGGRRYRTHPPDYTHAQPQSMHTC